MMDATAWWLVVGVVFAGMWSGLLVMVTMVLHLMMREQDGPTFARQLAMFLPVARRSPAN